MPMPMHARSTVADLFTGLGGFTEGATQAGATVVFAANHWQDAINWHKRRHPNTRHICQDLKQFNFTELPDVDILIASPACQGHSTGSAPARKGTGGPKGTNMHQIARRHQADRATAWAVIAACDARLPRSVIVENVPRFRHWALFDQWVGCFEALGYHVTVHDVNAKDFGVPQDRRRCVVTASLDRPIDLYPTTAYASPWKSIGDVLEPADAVEWTPVKCRTERIQRLITKAKADAGSNQAVVNNVDSAVGRSLDGIFPTITTKGASQLIVIDGNRCRNIGGREVARIQGFPDDYPIPAKKTLAGKLIGNAIPVPLAAAAVDAALAAA